jgi:hypothetical protein
MRRLCVCVCFGCVPARDFPVALSFLLFYTSYIVYVTSH